MALASVHTTRKLYTRLSLAAVITALCIGVSVMLGWLLYKPFLLTLVPGQVSMKCNAALALVLASLAILFRVISPRKKMAGHLALLCSWLVILIGAITLCEYIFPGMQFSIDQWLVKDHSQGSLLRPAGRMSLPTAIQFIFFGTCLLCWNRTGTALYQFTCFSCMGFVAVVMLIGVNFIEDAPYMLKMALHLAIGFILLIVAAWYLQHTLHNRVSVERRLYTGFASVLLLVCIIAIYSYYNNNERARNALWVRHTGEVMLAMSEFITTIKDWEGTAHTIPDKTYTGPLSNRNTAALQLEKIERLTTDNPLQQARADSLSQLFYLPAHMITEKARLKQLLELSERMLREENGLLLSRQQENAKSILSANRVFFIFIIFVCLVLVGLFMAVKHNDSVRRRSESKFKAFLESSPDAKVIVDEQGKIQLINLQTELLFGYDRTELIGQPVEWLMPEGLRHKHVGNRENFIRSSKTREMGSGLELNAQRKDGSTFPVEISLAPIRTEEGLWISASVRNIEERKKAQEKATHLARLIENTSEAFFSSDAAFRIKSWNKAAERLFGYKEKEVIGKPSVNVMRPQTDEDTRQEIRQKLKEEGFWKGEVMCLKKDGLPVYLSVSNTATFNTQKEVDGYVTICMDYSQRKKLEEQLQAANAELEAFTYSVSHDLRAPVRAIIGFTNILETEYTDKLDEEAKRLTNIIKTNTRRMGNLIDDLLTFARTSRQHIIRHMLSMQAMVQEVVAGFSQSYPGIAWNVRELPDTMGDITMVRQVWTNLVSNAVKYSSGRQHPVIEIGGEEQEYGYMYYVRDNGVGFNAAYQAKLFQVFQRLHTQEEFEGTGVGLAIVEKIVSKHGGTVWAESDGQSGAVFYFSLPKNYEQKNA